MNLAEKIKHFALQSMGVQGVIDEQFLPKEIFRRIIDRERDRANRTGEVFTLVIFAVSGNQEKETRVKLLAKTLATRIRSIDETGWLDLSHVGVLLPETNTSGAEIFAKKICQEVLASQSPPSYEILTYPSASLVDPECSLGHDAVDHPASHQNSSSGCSQPGRSTRDVARFYSFTRKLVKRSFDFVGAASSLVFLSPLFLLTAALIKIVSPGPVLFKQQRIGYGGEPFTLIKFRTMHQNAATENHQNYLAKLISGGVESDSDTPMAKLDNDPQIIPFGGLLRKSCLDELPQLFNVLRGEMSLVGPRPPIPYEVKEYLSWHRGRFDAIPGMTGLWQVSGKNKLTFREMVRLDIRYAKKESFWLDLFILFKTPIVIFQQLREWFTKKDLTIKQGV